MHQWQTMKVVDRDRGQSPGPVFPDTSIVTAPVASEVDEGWFTVAGARHRFRRSGPVSVFVYSVCHLHLELPADARDDIYAAAPKCISCAGHRSWDEFERGL